MTLTPEEGGLEKKPHFGASWKTQNHDYSLRCFLSNVGNSIATE